MGVRGWGWGWGCWGRIGVRVGCGVQTVPVLKPDQAGLRQTWLAPQLPQLPQLPQHCLLPQLLQSHRLNEGSRVPAPRKGDTAWLCFHPCRRGIVFLHSYLLPTQVAQSKWLFYVCLNQSPPFMGFLTLEKQPSFHLQGEHPSSFHRRVQDPEHCLMRELEPKSPHSKAHVSLSLSQFPKVLGRIQGQRDP